MSFRSSIFSFDTLRLDRRVPVGLLVALAALLAIDFGVSRADWPYHLLGPSYVKEFLTANARAASISQPRVVILGNSRSQAGLPAVELEGALGLPSGSVQNFSLRTGDHYDNRLFYRRNREVLRHAPVLIYAIDAYQWNSGFALSERFNHFAGLRERWALQRTPQSLLGYFLRTAQKGPLYRAMATELAARARGLCSGQPAAAAAPAPDPDFPVATRAVSLDQASGLDPAGNLIETWYNRFQLSPAREALLRDFLAGASADGQRVILVQLPFRDAYMREVRRTHAGDYRAYLARVSALSGVDVILFEEASQCGLADADFFDWNHLNTAGAAKFTRILAERLPAVVRAQVARCEAAGQ